MERMNDEQRRLVEENMALVGFTMMKYFPNSIPEREWEDFMSIGTIGMCKAALKYATEKGTFSSYAVKAIRREIKREFVDRYRGKRKHNGMLTLDALTGDDQSLEETLAADQPSVELLVNIHIAMEALTKADRETLQAQMAGLKVREIAEANGWTKQGVEYHLKRAKRLMRESIAVG